MKQALVGKAALLSDQPDIAHDLRPRREAARGHKAGFLKQRQIAVALVVALDPRIAVPVPHPAEIAGVVDVAEIGDALLRQIVTSHDSAKSGAQDRDVEFLVQRIARLHRHVRIGVVQVMQLARAVMDILRAVAGIQALVTLGIILCAQGRDVELFGRRNCGRLAGHGFSRLIRYGGQLALIDSLVQ